jgi:hypothetical protein
MIWFKFSNNYFIAVIGRRIRTSQLRLFYCNKKNTKIKAMRKTLEKGLFLLHRKSEFPVYHLV